MFRPFRCLLACLALTSASPAWAQLKISYDAASEPQNLQVIALRPNAVQPVFFSYYNPGPGARKNVKVTLEQVGADGKGKKIAETVVPKVDVKKWAPVSFAAALPPPKDVKDAKEGSSWPKLDGPPFVFRFLVDDGTTKEPVKLDVPIKLQEPREYVKVREAKYDPQKRRLSFKVASDEILDPPCPVELVLQPSAIPGLKPSTAGTFKQVLSKENQEVELSADNVEFEGGVPPANGRVYLNIDGFDRAYGYKCAFADGSLTPLKDDMRVRLVVPRFSLPSKKTAVIIEVDARGQEDADEDILQRSTVDLKFDRAGQGNYERTLGSPYRGLRDQSIEYKAEGEAMIFKTRVKDHLVELNTEGINGKRSLRVTLINPKQRVVPVANEQDGREEKVAIFSQGAENKFAPLTFDKINDAVVGELVLDSSPAEELKIDGVGIRVRAEDPIKPKLTVRPRVKGQQAPIEEVLFFFGEADKDHKLPDGAKKFEAVWDVKQEAYVPKEDLIVPAELRGRTFLSAIVRTQTGVPMTSKQPVNVISKDAKDPTEPDVLTTITGTVSRGGRLQPNTTVMLAKAKPDKDDVPKEVKTKDDGKFEFKDVEPGNYVISARRLEAGVARQTINVPKNKEKITGVDLQLKIQ